MSYGMQGPADSRRAAGTSEDSQERHEALVLLQRWNELKPRVIRPLGMSRTFELR